MPIRKYSLSPARLPGWETAFVRVMESHMALPFAWGVSDCLIVPADLCQVMTGVDPMKGLRRYRSEMGALHTPVSQNEEGASDLIALCRCGFLPVPQIRGLFFGVINAF